MTADLFGQDHDLPQGLRYQPELIDPVAEAGLVEAIAALAFQAFEFHGFVGKRRVVSFGHRYDFSGETLRDADELPGFLLPLREAAAGFAGLPSQALVHAMVTEYQEGAGIGWHRDKRVFDDVIGISLAAPCTMRFRRARRQGGWQRASLRLEPRSIYLLRGPVRTDWEHSIPGLESLRYSVTFRTLAAHRS